ncbi:hypothetical protein [Pseudolysinimonas sp.]|uniref:hypothetical protein n=1 Tax=Pseudolysinimonas sp. TaxID=2680009 RepID=UPI00286C6A30|nr:hypothetical protein [Pseudolysinimonas sp.]
MRTSHRTRLIQLGTALTGAALLMGVTVGPAAAAPPPEDDHATIAYPSPHTPIAELFKLDTTVPTVKLPDCKGLLSPDAPSLFGAYLSGVTPTDDGTHSAVISGIITANRGTVCAWHVSKTKNYIQFSVTPISESQRATIIADWVARFGTSGYGVGGRNLIFHSGSITTTESAMLLEEGLYITATPVDGTMFPAFIQAQGDHIYDLTH